MIIAGIFGLFTTIITIMAAVWAFTPENSSSNALSAYLKDQRNYIKDDETKAIAKNIYVVPTTSDSYEILYFDSGSSVKVIAKVNYTGLRKYKITDRDESIWTV